MATKGLVSLLIQAKDDASQAIDAVIKKNAELQKVEKASAASARELTAAEKNLAEAQKLGFKSAKDLLAAIDAKTGRLRVNAATVKQTTAATVAGTQASASHSRAVQNEVNQLRGLGIQAQRVGEQETRLLALRGRLATATQSQQQSVLVTQQLGRAATGAAPGFNRLQNAVQQLAFGLSGIPGAAGRVISTLATFTLGGGWTLGVVAGITAIVAIWDRYTRGAREARQATLDLIDAQVKANDERTGVATNDRRLRSLLAVTDAQLKLEKLREREAKLLASPAKPSTPGVADVGALELDIVRAQIRAADKELQRAKKSLAENRAVGKESVAETQNEEIALIRARIDAGKESAADLSRLNALRLEFTKKIAEGNLKQAEELKLREQLAAITDAQTAITERGAEASERLKKAQDDEVRLLQQRAEQGRTTLTDISRLRALEAQLATALEQKNLALAEELRLRERLSQVQGALAANPALRAVTELGLPNVAQTGKLPFPTRPLPVVIVGPGQAPAGAPIGTDPGDIGRSEETLRFIDDMRLGLTNALADFLSRGIATFESLGQAVQEFGLAIARTLADIISQKAAEKAVDKLFSFLKLAEGGVVTRRGGQPVALDSGGVVRGPGTSTSDSIPALLSNGEGVVTARGVDMLGGAAGIAYINQLALRSHRRVPRFAEGGVVGAATGSGITSNPTRVSVEASSDLVVRQIENGPGERAVIRVLEKNRRGARSALGI